MTKAGFCLKGFSVYITGVASDTFAEQVRKGIRNISEKSINNGSFSCHGYQLCVFRENYLIVLRSVSPSVKWG